jgi:hypothetical protein
MDEGVAQAEAVHHDHELALRTIQMGVYQRYEQSSVDCEVAEPGGEASCAEEWFRLQHRR